jgi:Mn-dependent DtxR family transcriptional regulator
MPLLSEREKTALTVFAHEGALGVTDLSNIMGLAMSSTYALMDKMEESGLIERTKSKKRLLTDYGDAIYQQLMNME